MADTEGVAALLARIDPSVGPHQPGTEARVRSEWSQAIEAAMVEPQMTRTWPLRKATIVADIRSAPDRPATPLQAFDAMIRFLEHLQANFRAAEDLLGEMYYSAASADGELSTRDPGAWSDWLDEIRVMRAER
jgi:hypothetical protein